MENSKSSYVKIINEICAEEGIKLSSYSYDWAFCLRKDSKRAFILGYQFGLNPSSVQQVCNDKNIASEVLKEEGIPSVYHACFMAPSMLQYTGGKGSWKALLSLLEKGPIVCKDNYGTGGNLVFKVETQAQLEEATSTIYASSEAMAVCDYEKIQSEYRLVVLDGQIRLAFSKIRPSLTGDGVSSVGTLLAEAIKNGQVHSFLVPGEAELSKVPKKGEKYLLNWKHNLGQGASALTLDIDSLDEELTSLVQKTAKALGIRFASIDMIKTDEGWKVLEVNAGVMMEHFASSGKEQYQIAKEIYRDAIRKMFEG